MLVDAWRKANEIILRFIFSSFCIQAKFLFMVRDGRATVNSIISRKVTITGFDLTSYRQCMSKWNHAIETMHNQCKEIGSEKCMMVSVLCCVVGATRVHFIDIFRGICTHPFPAYYIFPFALGVLRAIGSASRRMDAKNIEISRCVVERFSVASRRIHQQAKRCVVIKVSFRYVPISWHIVTITSTCIVIFSFLFFFAESNAHRIK